jgi:hypothetical protein
MKSPQLLPLLLSFATTSPTNTFCTLSDILSNNQSCLPPISTEGSFVLLPPFELQLQLDSNSVVIDASSLGYGVEYYLNFTLGQFDDDEGFENGGFGYAIVDDVSMSTDSAWEVSARAYYNLSPGGWIFSTVPSETELMRRVETVIEGEVDANGRAKFGTVMETLLDGLNVVGVGVTSIDAVGSPSAGPTSTDAPTENPTTLPPSPSPTKNQIIISVANRPNESPQSMPTPTPSVQITTLAPSLFNDALVEASSTLPAFVPENGLTSTTSPSSEGRASQSDHSNQIGLASENVDNGHSSTVYQTNTTTETTHNNTQEDASKVLLASPNSSSPNNKSTIIASATITISFLLLLSLSVGIFIKRHGIPKRKVNVNKDRPLAEADLVGFYSGAGEVSDVEGALVSDHGDDAEFVDEKTVCVEPKHYSAAAATPMKLAATESALSGELATESNTGMNQQRASESHPNEASAVETATPTSTKAANLSNEQSHTFTPNQNDTSRSTLSTSTEKGYNASFVINHYDEEKIAKKEMARELFLTKEEVRESVHQNDITFSEMDFNTGDLGFTKEPRESSCLGVCYQNEVQEVDIESSPSLEYSASDGPSIKISYYDNKNSALQAITTNIISPSSLPDRRNSFRRQMHRPDPPEFTDRQDPPDENNATVVTNDDSLHSVDDDDSSAFFPELNSSWNEATPDAAWDHNDKWKLYELNRCIVDCAPTSLKDLIMPMRENKDCEENNELAVAGDKWLNRALCGKVCDGNYNPRRSSPTFSSGCPEFGNDWDFDDAKDEGDIQSGEDAFGL